MENKILPEYFSIQNMFENIVNLGYSSLKYKYRNIRKIRIFCMLIIWYLKSYKRYSLFHFENIMNMQAICFHQTEWNNQHVDNIFLLRLWDQSCVNSKIVHSAFSWETARLPEESQVNLLVHLLLCPECAKLLALIYICIWSERLI